MCLRQFLALSRKSQLHTDSDRHIMGQHIPGLAHSLIVKIAVWLW